MRKLLQWFSRAIIRIFFREVIVEGHENLPESGSVLFAPNHPNALLDPLLIEAFFQRFRVRFVAKAPLFKIPIFGAVLRSIGAIPVVRRIDVNTSVDYTKFFEACVEALRSGDSIAIFPEGRSLPQPFLAPLRTGPARLFFMAREQSIPVQIVPIGLNYESGSIFRSAVQISIAPPLNTMVYQTEYLESPSAAIKNLTEEIGDALEKNVFQAESYRDRELILLLERLYSREETPSSSWSERLSRLRLFEAAINDLRNTHSTQLDKIRHLLSRYQRISSIFQIDSPDRSKRSAGIFLLSIAGIMIASVGWIINIVPYKLIDYIVRFLRKDESEAATFKILFGLILFPLTYVLETIAIYSLFGKAPAILFAVLIIPLTLFTLKFFEWKQESGGFITSMRVEANLARLKERIIAEVDLLAAELQRQ